MTILSIVKAVERSALHHPGPLRLRGQVLSDERPHGSTAARGARRAGSSQRDHNAVLGILGFLCCQLCAPFAWYIGKTRRSKAIKAGHEPGRRPGTAMAGMILGIIGTIFLVLGVLWIFFFGGMAILSAMAGAGGQLAAGSRRDLTVRRDGSGGRRASGSSPFLSPSPSWDLAPPRTRSLSFPPPHRAAPVRPAA